MQWKFVDEILSIFRKSTDALIRKEKNTHTAVNEKRKTEKNGLCLIIGWFIKPFKIIITIFFRKLIKLVLRCIDAHLQFWISGRWLAYFMLHPRYLKMVVLSTGALFMLTILSGYSSFIYSWLKIIVFLFEMLISRWYILKVVDYTLSVSFKYVISSNKELNR